MTKHGHSGPYHRALAFAPNRLPTLNSELPPAADCSRHDIYAWLTELCEVRDLASYAKGLLVLAGPAGAGGGNYAVYWWDGAGESIRLLRDLADVTGKKRKAEALLPLEVSPSGLRALIFFDREKQGAPVAVEMPLP